MDCIQDLEVNDSVRVPFKRMRYPVENGEVFQQRVRMRRNQIMEHLQCSYDLAEEVTDLEFAHLMATTKEMVSDDDPGNSRVILAKYGIEDERFIQQSIYFFQNSDTALVTETPMKTFQKFRYGSGVNLDLLKRSERPDRKDFWTLNTNRLTNIASQLNLKGCYSPEEEFLEQQKEKSMLKCAHEFGVMANFQVENFEFLQKAVRQARPTDVNNSNNVSSGGEELVVRSDVASTTHGASRKLKILLK